MTVSNIVTEPTEEAILIFYIRSGDGGTPSAPENPGGFIETDGNYVERAAITDLSFVPSGTGKFTFPSPWSTTGFKLTDSAGNYSSDDVIPVGYSYWRISNNHVGSDEMKILVGLPSSEGGASIITFNKVTEAISAPVPIFTAASYETFISAEQMHFSATDPNILYYTDNSNLYRKVNVDTGVMTTVFDAEDITAGYRCKQSHTSNDDRYHSLTYMDGSFNNIGTVVYDETLDTFKTFVALDDDLDESQISRDGNWLVIKENVNAAQGEDNRIIDLSDDSETLLDDLDGAAGHSDMGWGASMAAADNYGGANVHKVWDLSQDPPVGTQIFESNYSVYAPQHISWCHADNSAVADQFVVGGSLSNPGDGLYGNEIIGIKLDGSGDVLVIAPVMTDEAAAGGSYFYNQQPKGNTDITGEYFFWTSNTGTSRIDLYMVKIPSQLFSA